MSMGEKLVQITENMRDVYGRGYVGGFQEGSETGYATGFSDGVKNGFDAGYNKGQEDKYDQFWNHNQAEGTRQVYQYAYVGDGFDFGNFYPKYDIRPIGLANHMFVNWNNGDIHKDSLKKRLEECGVVLDTSQATNLTQAFFSSYFTELPEINLPAGSTTTRIFGNMPYLKAIVKLVAEEKTLFQNCFQSVPELETVLFSGVIGQNGLDLSGSPLLSQESLLSLIDCLKDYSGSSKEYSVTLGSENLAKLTESQKAVATQKGWRLT